MTGNGRASGRRQPQLVALLCEWEWACCGEPFGVGDRVTLSVSEDLSELTEEFRNDPLAADVDVHESHHGPELPRLTATGTVAAIAMLVDQYRRPAAGRMARPIGSRCQPVETVDPDQFSYLYKEPQRLDPDDTTTIEEQAGGWLVTLTDVMLADRTD